METPRCANHYAYSPSEGGIKETVIIVIIIIIIIICYYFYAGYLQLHTWNKPRL